MSESATVSTSPYHDMAVYGTSCLNNVKDESLHLNEGQNRCSVDVEVVDPAGSSQRPPGRQSPTHHLLPGSLSSGFHRFGQ